ncbi:uncharacterized protein LOC121919564 [Sceloporus undulatus]|uniref:uncharacterized protein LOC121919564 n=1 Tax=Sceloporus undulatus TaxID=8520 RepID=UPI001C4C2C90|nr:uncharacterized protein LOC121919564 [Sceloporus undulatus]
MFNKDKERCVLMKQFLMETEELSTEEAKIAEEAKWGAQEILQDALKKKDKVLMKIPEKVILKGEETKQFWMERHAVMTEDKVQKLIAELKKVTFKKDNSLAKTDTIAYVYPHDETKTIYLSPWFFCFFPKYLGRNSQPGILIHEVSHFLGADDLTYEESTFFVGCKGSMVKGNLSPAHNSTIPLLKEDYWDALKKAFWNAKNIQHEFELTINHSKEYMNGKYLCCGETKRYSVCESSVPDHFHTCNFQKTWETVTLIEELRQRSESIEHKWKECPKILIEIIESLNKAEAASKVSEWSSVGAIASSLVGLILAPATCGLSTMLTTAAFPVASIVASGVVISSTSDYKTFIARADIKMKELKAILHKYKHSSDILKLIKFLSGPADTNPI